MKFLKAGMKYQREVIMLPDKDYYRPDEVAKHYDVKVKTVYGWIAEGKLEAEKICGGTIRIPRESIGKMAKTTIN